MNLYFLILIKKKNLSSLFFYFTAGETKREDFVSLAAQNEPEITDALMCLTRLNQSHSRQYVVLSGALQGRIERERA